MRRGGIVGGPADRLGIIVDRPGVLKVAVPGLRPQNQGLNGRRIDLERFREFGDGGFGLQIGENGEKVTTTKSG